jgi:hypothetical protein
MLTFSHPGSRIPGSKRHPIPDPGSATLVAAKVFLKPIYSIQKCFKSIYSIQLENSACLEVTALEFYEIWYT